MAYAPIDRAAQLRRYADIIDSQTAIDYLEDYRKSNT